MARTEREPRGLVRRARGLPDKVRGLGGGAPLLPLGLLFAFNAMDELDREAFTVLLPEIRDHFALDYTGVTALIAAIVPASLLFAVPIARFADRVRRVPIAIAGATLWGVFSLFTGLAPVIVLLALSRIGAGIGRAVNDPVHGSLLSDYYGPTSRARVFSVHRGANTVGAFFGALGAGFIARALDSWRAPFILLAIPTVTLIILAVILLREPPRTGRRLSEGEGHPKFREAFKTLWGIGTMRRIWMAFPFVAFVAISMGQIMSLYYNDIFAVAEGGRGMIRAFDAPFIVLGLVVGSPIIDRGIVSDPRRVMHGIGLFTVAIALLFGGLAVAPVLPMAIAFNYAISAFATVLYAGGFAVISLVAPPEGRATAFAFFNIAALLGVIAIPLMGRIADLFGLRVGVAFLIPVLLIGAYFLGSSGRFVKEDIERVNAEPEEDPPPAPDVP